MNKVFLTGNLGRDLEAKEVNGKTIARGSLATRRSKDVTDWHNITIWGKAAEIALQYCKKGSKLTVIGQVNYSKVEKDGETRTYTEINVSEIELASQAEERPQTHEEEETAEEFLERMKEAPKESSVKPQTKAAPAKEPENDLPF